jgi:transposase
METEATPTPAPKKPGRPPLSPHGLDKEFRQAAERRHAARRKAKANRRRTIAGKRQAACLRRAQRKHMRRLRLCEPAGETVGRRLKAVRYYDHWRGHGLTAAAAAQRRAQHYGGSAETLRRWARRYRTGGLAALLPQPPGPVNGAYKVSVQTQLRIVALRRLLGWHEKRIAVELAQRGIAQVSHTTVGRIFARYHLPTRPYCSCAKREGLRYRRYAKAGPNQQWHIDFTATHLADGSRVVVVVLIDDYSRYCLRCRVVSDTEGMGFRESVLRPSGGRETERPPYKRCDRLIAHSPCVGFRRLPAGARPDSIQSFEDFVCQLDLQCTQAALELRHRARADNRRGDDRIAQQPRQPHISRVFAQLGA